MACNRAVTDLLKVADASAAKPSAIPATVVGDVQAAAAKFEAPPARNVAVLVASVAVTLAADKVNNADPRTLNANLRHAFGTVARADGLVAGSARSGHVGTRADRFDRARGHQLPEPRRCGFRPAVRALRLTPGDLFNLTVSHRSPDGQTTTERFLNLSAKNGRSATAPSRYDWVLAGQSMLVQAPENVDFSVLGPIGDAVIPFDSTTGADSGPLTTDVLTSGGDTKTGLYALDKTDFFDLLCIPPDSLEGNTDPGVYAAAAVLCRDRRAFLIMDPPVEWGELAKKGSGQPDPTGRPSSGRRRRGRQVHGGVFPARVQAGPDDG